MTTIPKGAKVPADHKSPAQAEAEGEATTVIAWREHEFTIPTDMDDMSVATLLALEENKAASAVRGLLGPKQWAELMATSPSVRDLKDLFDQVGPAIGLERSGN